MAMKSISTYQAFSASKGLDKEETKKEGRYIRKERYAGAMSRSFYVGDDVAQEEISAKFEDGILRLAVPKKDKKEIENNKFISIEG